MESCLFLLVLVIAVAALIVAITTRSKLQWAETELRALRARLDGAPPPSAAPEPEPIPVPPPVPEPEFIRPRTLEVAIPVFERAAEGGGAPLSTPPPVAEGGWEPLSTPPFAAEGGGAPLSTPPPPPPTPSKPFDWESVVGVKLFSWIAGIALVLAAVFFLKYSVEHGWVSPTVRAFVGISTGIALIVICELRIAANYRITANAMHGAAIAILYATLFSMHALWGLVPAGVAFFLMLVVTGVAVFLSVRRDSVFIALLGLLGGFATPALLSSGENRPIVLFSYLFMLNAGLAAIAWWKRWPALTALSVVLTAVYQWGWIIKFLDASQMPLAAGIFITFAVVAALGLWVGRREEDRNQLVFDRIATAGAALPLLFGLFTAAMPVYAARFNTLFGFLILVAAGLAMISIKRGSIWLHQLGGMVVLMTFAVWSAVSYTSAAWPSILAWTVAFMLLYLVASLKFDGRGADPAAVLFFMFAALAAMEPAARWPVPLFGVGLVMLVIVGYFAIRTGALRLHAIASILLFISLCIWTGQHLERATTPAILIVLTAFTFIALGVSVTAARAESPRSLTPLFATLPYILFAVVAHRGEMNVFAALTATTVACAFVAVYLRRTNLLAVSLAGAQIALMVWATVATTGSLPIVAMMATLAVAAIGVVCFILDRDHFSDPLALAIALGHFVVLLASASAPLGWIIASHLVLIITALSIGKHVLAPIEAALATMGASLARTNGPAQELTLASALYAPFILYPLIIGERARKSLHPYFAAVLMSVSYFFLARNAIIEAGLDAYIGLLPLLQAALMGLLVKTLLRIEPELTRLAMTAGAALAFVTVAIPLQLDKEWITIAWALEAAALLWLYRRVPHNGLIAWSIGLFAVVFARLAFNPAVLNYHAASGMPIVNWYLYTFLVPALAFYVGAWLLRDDQRVLRNALNAGGTVLLFLLLNVEIADFYSTGRTITFNFFSSSLAQELTYTIGWAVFAIGMLVAGIALQARPARIAALALLFVTILKCFLHDLGRLGGLYRVGSLLGLAISLVLVGVLLQKFVMLRGVAAGRSEPAPQDSTS